MGFSFAHHPHGVTFEKRVQQPVTCMFRSTGVGFETCQIFSAGGGAIPQLPGSNPTRVERNIIDC